MAIGVTASLYRQAKNGSENEPGVSGGDADWKQTAPAWINFGTGLLGAISNIRREQGNLELSKIENRIRDEELKLSLTNEMTAARERSKLRRENLERSLSNRALRTAMSGLAQEGSAIAGAAQDYERSAEDERAERVNLRQSQRVSRNRVQAANRVNRFQAEESLLATRTNEIGNVLQGLKGLPL